MSSYWSVVRSGTNLSTWVSNGGLEVMVIKHLPIAIDCGPLTIANGAVDTSSGTTFMMTATYTCNPGYTLVGAVTRTCQANTMWSLSAPTCTGMPRVVKCIEDTSCFHSPVFSWAPLQWNGDLLTFWWPSTSWSSGHLLLWHWLWTKWC